MLFIQRLFQTDTYKKLMMLNTGNEGNMLQEVGDQVQLSYSAEAQLEALRYVIAAYINNREPVIVETGTNKGFFSFIMAHLVYNPTVYTFDINPVSEQAVNILKNDLYGDRLHFFLGDSKKTLTTFSNTYKGPDVALAWVDGFHDYDTCLHDLSKCDNLRAKVILIDDTKHMPILNKAINSFLNDVLNYERIDNPYWPHDKRGITVLVRK